MILRVQTVGGPVLLNPVAGGQAVAGWEAFEAHTDIERIFAACYLHDEGFELAAHGFVPDPEVAELLRSI